MQIWLGETWRSRDGAYEVRVLSAGGRFVKYRRTDTAEDRRFPRATEATRESFLARFTPAPDATEARGDG